MKEAQCSTPASPQQPGQGSPAKQMPPDPCPVCLKPMAPPYVTSCSHKFCQRCLAEHFYRRHFVDGQRWADSAACPYCRQRVLFCRPAGGGQGTPRLDLQIGRVVIEVPIGDAPVAASLALIFNVPASSIKLIHKGLVVKREDELRALAARHAKLTFLSSRLPRRTYRDLLSLVYSWLLARALALWHVVHAKLLAPLLRRMLPFWRSTLEPCVHLIQAFLWSASPNYQAGGARKVRKAPIVAPG